VNGGFFETKASDLFMHRKDPTDGSEPSGSAVAARSLRRLSAYGAPSGRMDLVEESIQSIQSNLSRGSTGLVSYVGVIASLSEKSREIVIATDDPDDPRALAMAALYNETPRPSSVFAYVEPGVVDELREFTSFIGKSPGDTGVRAFVCHEGVCQSPTDDVSVFESLLNDARSDHAQ